VSADEATAIILVTLVGSSALIGLLLVAASATGASAISFSITNHCMFTVWPAAIPVGGGRKLNSGDTWDLDVPSRTSSARIWGRTGCSFNGSSNGSSGSCATGDCAGALSCAMSGKPPATLAEFLIGDDQDFYQVSVIDGFNIALDFSCSTGATLRCQDAN
jgi:hypothetical protein